MTDFIFLNMIKTYLRGGVIMEDKIKKTIIFENELHDKIVKMAEENERDFSKQVKFMLREYIKLKESK